MKYFKLTAEQGELIRIARERAGISKNDLARRIGIARNTLYNWETGTFGPRQRHLDSFQRIYEVLQDPSVEFIRDFGTTGVLSDKRNISRPSFFSRGLPLKYRRALQATRYKYGLSQKELAQKIGLNQPTLSAWETGKQSPSISYSENFKKIYEVLHQDPEVKFVLNYTGHVSVKMTSESESENGIVDNLEKLLRIYKLNKDPLKEIYSKLEAVFTHSLERDAAQLFSELEFLITRYESKLAK